MQTSRCAAIVLVLGVATATGACGLNAVGKQASDSMGDSLDSGAPGPSGDAAQTKPGGDASADSNTDTPDAPDNSEPGANDGNRGPIVLYDFKESDGTTIHDRTDNPYDLEITDQAHANGDAFQQDHALVINNYTIIQSSDTGLSVMKVAEACKKTKEISVEAWVESAQQIMEADLTPIVTMAKDATNITFALGTNTYTKYRLDHYYWWASIKNGDNLAPSASNSPKVTSDFTHLVATTTADGTLSIYVNGQSAGTQKSILDCENYPLVIGNMPEMGHGWKGTIHLIAIYGRALTEVEVKQNTAAGPNR